jgi:hypothetical protein
MRKALILVSAIALTGCAFSQLNDGLPHLVGQPLNMAVNVLGLPNQKMDIGPYTVYVWDNSSSGVIPIMQTSTATTSGMVGNVPVYGSATVNSMGYMPVQYQCQIKLRVDSQLIVQSWEWAGNQGGCARYGNRLQSLFRK